MHAIQLAYRHAKEQHDRLEREALQRLKETKAFNTLPPDWEHIASTQAWIEQLLGLPASRRALQERTKALLSFALERVSRHGTAQQEALLRKVMATPFLF